jgi:ribonuclease E
MLINASAEEEVRVAIVEDGVLTDLDVETASREKIRGNIYKGIVANVEASLDAAFIEFGHAKQGFLAFDDLRPELWDPSWKGEGRPRITDVLHRRQEIVVQVIKEEMGSKGAAVTSYLSLPGRYVVLMHSGGGRGGVSRKIEDEKARQKAKETLDKLKAPDDLGIIIRTAGTGRSRAELQKDLNSLSRQWQKMMESADIARAPSLLYREPDLVVRTIRDYLAPDVDEVLIDDPDEHEEAVLYFSGGPPPAAEPEAVAPPPSVAEKSDSDRIKLYQGNVPLFEKFGVESQIEALYKRVAPLPSGGSISIDQTEALVAIDVNSGRSTRESDHESTVYKTNLEAAAEIARQLRLRDMGGIVVVDFIDMESRRHDRDVESRVKEAVKTDKARVKVGRISDNGLLEITRQRLRQAHRLVSHEPCPSCKGTGVIRAVPGQAVAALRELQTRAAGGGGLLSAVSARLPVEVANHLQNHKRLELEAVAGQWNLRVEVLADPALSHGDAKFDEERRGRAALAVPPAPVVRDDDWRGRRRQRPEERAPAPRPGGTIEDRQEQHFNDDRTRTTRPAGRSERPARLPRAPDRAPVRADEAPLPAPVPAEPRHYPDDALMEALFGDPPELAAVAEPRAALPAEPAPPAGVTGEAPAAEAGDPVAPGDPQPSPAAGATAAPPGEEGAAKKRRRRRRRRKKGSPQGVVLGPDGLPVPGPAPADDAALPGEDDEVADDIDMDDVDAPAGAEPSTADLVGHAFLGAGEPGPSVPAGVDPDLMSAASQLLLGDPPAVSRPLTVSETQLPVVVGVPASAPEPAEQEESAPVARLPSWLAPSPESPAAQPAPGSLVPEARTLVAPTLPDADGLGPLPPPGPAAEETAPVVEAPTVVAKRARKARTTKPRTSAPAKPRAPAPAEPKARAPAPAEPKARKPAARKRPTKTPPA